ncbi:MAG: hypothetical protein IPJ36_19300 [Simplicispira sp.]|nr:hypothetical protein [Simplicispira sp.]
METSLPTLLLQLLHGFALWLLSSVHIALAIAVTLHALMKDEGTRPSAGSVWRLAPFAVRWRIGCWASTASAHRGGAGPVKARQSGGDPAREAVPDEAVDAPLGGVARWPGR